MSEKVFTATELLIDRAAVYDAATLFRALEKAGMLSVVEYPSTTGTGEVKTFKALVGKGLEYGVNKETIHKFKTECRFYDHSFDRLLTLVGLK